MTLNVFIYNNSYRFSCNKHGNSVTNSKLSFQIILKFSIVIPTEKVVIRKIFVCYVYNLFVYVLTATVVLSKTRKLQYTNRVNLSVFTVHPAETLYRHIFTVFYPFHKINSSRHNNIMALKLGITMLNHNKDDMEFVTEFPCFLGHPVLEASLKNWGFI